MVENRKLSFGVELELANVDRRKDIPSTLGSWECGDKKNELGVYLGREKCIINSDLSVVDPDGVRCYKGGEIHTVPSWSIDTLTERINELFKLFPEADMFLPGKMHIHVGIPEWTFEEFKNIILYTVDNDVTLMDAMCSDEFMDTMMNDASVPEDLKYHYLESRRTINNPDIAKKILDHFSLTKYLTGIYGATLDGRLKNKGDIIACCLQQEQLNHQDCIMVGDRQHDIIGAHQNQIPCIGVLYGYGDLEEFQKYQCDYIVEDLKELKKIIEEWTNAK